MKVNRPDAGTSRGGWPDNYRNLVDPPISAERRRDISYLAEAIGNEYAGSGQIDLLSIANRKEITTSFGGYGEGFDGMLEYKNGRFHIYNNLDRLGTPDSPRARFTMAHELGHYFIDEHRNLLASGEFEPHLSECEFDSSELIEQEADLFAANLLMPVKSFIELGESQVKGFECIMKLAEEFGTSITATAVRYVSLDVWPCVLIKWHRQGCNWKSFSSSMFRHHFSNIFEIPGDLSAECATIKALAQDIETDSDYFSNGTLVSTWFQSVKFDSPLDVVLIEEAVPLGKHGALTLLTATPGCPILMKKHA